MDQGGPGPLGYKWAEPLPTEGSVMADAVWMAPLARTYAPCRCARCGCWFKWQACVLCEEPRHADARARTHSHTGTHVQMPAHTHTHTCATTGVELAAEVAEAHPNKRVTLINRSSPLLRDLPTGASTRATKWLQSRGVQLQLGSSVVDVLDAQDGMKKVLACTPLPCCLQARVCPSLG